ncbi:MAG: pyroglutamyl-peptidase I [Deltaproteobacteria bacterium]|nr:MAG: pyroglutamyl-peptidase I [Deltaproteobacteria bacterium]
MPSLNLLGSLVVTGFEPFGPYDCNPSQQLVESLSEDPELRRWTGRVLPVSAQSLPHHLDDLFAMQPRAIVALGLADCPAIRLERVGVNVADFRIPDNTDQQPQDLALLPDGPDAYFSTLPIRDLLEDLLEAGIPATLSNTAGTYLCNMLLYLLLHRASLMEIPALAGFVHLPQTPDMVAQRLLEGTLSQPSPSMTLETQRAALKVILQHIETHLADEDVAHD